VWIVLLREERVEGDLRQCQPLSFQTEIPFQRPLHSNQIVDPLVFFFLLNIVLGKTFSVTLLVIQLTTFVFKENSAVLENLLNREIKVETTL
jgi:hypothetical protein